MCSNTVFLKRKKNYTAEGSTLMTHENPWLSAWADLLHCYYSCLSGFTSPVLSPLDQLSHLLDWCWENVSCRLRGYVHLWYLYGVSCSNVVTQPGTHINKPCKQYKHTHVNTNWQRRVIELVLTNANTVLDTHILYPCHPFWCMLPVANTISLD